MLDHWIQIGVKILWGVKKIIPVLFDQCRPDSPFAFTDVIPLIETELLLIRVSERKTKAAFLLILQCTSERLVKLLVLDQLHQGSCVQNWKQNVFKSGTINKSYGISALLKLSCIQYFIDLVKIVIIH